MPIRKAFDQLVCGVIHLINADRTACRYLPYFWIIIWDLAQRGWLLRPLVLGFP